MGTVITPRGTILHSTDLLLILRDMEVAFSNGIRSVVVTMEFAETEPQITYEYHLVNVS